MSQQQENNNSKKECFFYFRYQMKLEFIPYVQEEIQHFIDLCQDRVHEDGARERIIVVLNKRIKDIDYFFNKNWSDYRAQQILRSRKLLTDFYKKYHELFGNTIEPNQLQITEIKRSKIQTQVTPISKMSQSNSKQQIKTVNKQNTIKERSNDKNKISWEKLPSNKIISSALTPNNYKSKVINFSGSIRRSDVNQILAKPKLSNDKSRLSSTSSDNIKISPISSISSKPSVKKDVYNKKLSKQEYITYLRKKNTQI